MKKRLYSLTNLQVLLLVSFFAIVSSCKKDSINSELHASVKVIPTENEPKQVRSVASEYGNILAYTTSGDQVVPIRKQEVYLLNGSGEVITQINFSDTVYQYMNAIPGLNGGFIICASSSGLPYISLFEILDNGEVNWTKHIPCTGGTNLNEPAILTYDNNYLVMYQSFGSGYYIWKGDANGDDIFHKKIPIPNAMHYGSGLNFGEKYVRFLHANDTLIVIQGVTFDLYSHLIENCFLRSVSESIVRRWYSTNYDSAHIESSAGLYFSNEGKIVLFGSKATNPVNEGFGDVFYRSYTPDGILENEVVFPRVGGTPNIIKNVIRSADGGYLLVGSNNQLFDNVLVSPNQMILFKLDANLMIQWTRLIPTEFPAKGFDAVYLKDGTIGLMGLLKDNYSRNKLLYMHLDASGEIIVN